MLFNPHKLLIEGFDPQSFEYIVEEKSNNAPATLYVRGPYLVAEEINRNKRRYPLDELIIEVSRYDTEMIKTNRAMGELNHPTSPEVNPERACHVITELKQDGNVFIGKSKILTSTPMGMIVRGLINEGIKLGMSSRALGQLIEEADAVNLVRKVRLVAVDCVADPSAHRAFVDGILESKQYVLRDNGELEECYDKFVSSIISLPRKDKEAYIKEAICNFIKSLNSHK